MKEPHTGAGSHPARTKMWTTMALLLYESSDQTAYGISDGLRFFMVAYLLFCGSSPVKALLPFGAYRDTQAIFMTT